MSNKVKFFICLFLGMFGVHKFIEKNYKMGIIYLCTLGLLGIGWIIDLVKYAKNFNETSTILTKEAINKIDNGELPHIEVNNLNLGENEFCCYIDKAYTFKDKTITTGYTGKSSGVSIRLAKGLTYRTGGHGSQAIRETYRSRNNGYLCITNKRIIFMAAKECFDKEFNKITAIQEYKDGVMIQIGQSSYVIIVKSYKEFMKVYNLVKNQ